MPFPHPCCLLSGTRVPVGAPGRLARTRNGTIPLPMFPPTSPSFLPAARARGSSDGGGTTPPRPPATDGGSVACRPSRNLDGRGGFVTANAGGGAPVEGAGSIGRGQGRRGGIVWLLPRSRPRWAAVIVCRGGRLACWGHCDADVRGAGGGLGPGGDCPGDPAGHRPGGDAGSVGGVVRAASGDQGTGGFVSACRECLSIAPGSKWADGPPPRSQLRRVADRPCPQRRGAGHAAPCDAPCEGRRARRPPPTRARHE